LYLPSSFALAMPSRWRALKRIHALQREGLSLRKVSAKLAETGVKISDVSVRKALAGAVRAQMEMIE
jgi:hypothetical protein